MAGAVLYMPLRAAGASLLAGPSASFAGGGTWATDTGWVWVMAMTGAACAVVVVLVVVTGVVGDACALVVVVVSVTAAAALAVGVSTAAGVLVDTAVCVLPPQAAKTRVSNNNAAITNGRQPLKHNLRLDWKFNRFSL